MSLDPTWLFLSLIPGALGVVLFHTRRRLAGRNGQRHRRGTLVCGAHGMVAASNRRIAAAVVAAVVSSAVPAGAQTSLQAGAGIIGAVPLGEFASAVPDGAGGLLGQLDVGLRGSVFSVGGETSWILYGDESRKVALGSLIPELPDASVTVNTTNAIWSMHARLRAQPQHGRWRPYADGLLGFMDVYTTTSVEGGTSCSGSDAFYCSSASGVANDSKTQARDFTLSYGGGAGVAVGFTRRDRAPRLDVSVRYLRGERTRYLTQGALRREGARLVRDFTESRTDMLTIYIGVAFGR